MLFLLNRSNSKNLSSSLFSSFGVGQSTFSSFSSTSTKRTFLLSRKIGPTFLVRSMMQRSFNRNLVHSFREKPILLPPGTSRITTLAKMDSNYVPKRTISDTMMQAIKKENNVEIKKIRDRKNDPASNHFLIQKADVKEGESAHQVTFTHSRMATGDKTKENPVYSSEDFHGKTYSSTSSPVQRGYEITDRNKEFSAKRLKEVPWNDLEKMEIAPLQAAVNMYKIKTEAPDIFDNFQTFHRDHIHNNKKMSPSEKYTATKFLQEWAYQDYLKRKK